MKAKWNAKAWLALLLKALISAFLLWLVARQMDLKAFALDMSTLHVGWLVGGILQMLLIPFLGGVRWQVVARAIGSSTGKMHLTRIFWIGMLFNQVLPSASGGDAVRVALVWRAGIALAKATSGVILERLAVLLTLVSLVVVLQPLCLPHFPLPGGFLGPRLLLAGGAGCLTVLFCADRVISRLPHWRVLELLGELSGDSRKTYLGRTSPYLVGWCLLTHLNLAFASLWLGRAVDLPLVFLDYLALIPIVTLVTTLPVSIGGWGIREGATVVLFGKMGVDSHHSLAFSILFGLSLVLVSLPGLPLLWQRRGQSLAVSNDGDSFESDATQNQLSVR